jgi:hypothetical protein
MTYRAHARLMTPQRLFLFLTTAVLATIVALTIAVGPARAAVVFDGSPGTAAPPATLGPYTMTPFADDARPLLANVSDVPSPLGGSVGFSPELRHDKIGMVWATWSHGYTGDVYYTNGATSATMTMPANTVAFYFYAEPEPFAIFNVTATTDSGATSGPVPVDGFGGAKYFGFYTTAGETIASITVSSTIDFAVGEFGIAVAPPCEGVVADKTSLWPPNHKLQTISLTDSDGDPVTITGVTQDEPVNGTDDGDTSPDAVAGATASQVQIRAERSGIGDGRVYEISFTGENDPGEFCIGSVQVSVPLNKHGTAVDSGQLYDSFGT